MTAVQMTTIMTMLLIIMFKISMLSDELKHTKEDVKTWIYMVYKQVKEE